ncbi:Eukaryotic translation initiation factor 4 gamma [Nesidiocoris tenuis]|uniref:Eukaryotic translation initiation factor 4 gamma n=1 Tax=Nesidiocoris tenuis TaxID=355587 RepID=A0ABN7AG57_9HEMI|nr:Eukaryotic translation initiation factor 4 gamma [Nesidiocoris tenuis]
MNDVKSPRPFNFEATNLKIEWQEWFENVGFYLTAAKKKKEVDEIKIAILLNQLGHLGVALCNTFKQDALIVKKVTDSVASLADVLKDYSDVVKAFQDYFAPRQNVLYERCKFNKLTLAKGQSLIEYITALKTAADTCEFRLIAQVPDDELLNLLLDEGNGLTLEPVVRR